jgi:hypothetical protein
MLKRVMAFTFLVFLIGSVASVGARSTPAAEFAPKYTFEVLVSTEWSPSSADELTAELARAGCPGSASGQYLDDLKAGLRQMAAYFYSATNGQMAITKFTLHTGGEQWENAAIRVLANRSYRPTAFVGGIEPSPRPYFPDTSVTTPTTIFAPAPIYLSRLWNGNGARCGAWSNPAGWRTIAHEWGHYALYLYDEYLNQSTSAAQYCDLDTSTIRTLRMGRDPAAFTSTTQSLMAYHYVADQFSLWDASGPSLNCRTTPQDTVHGASNWETIKRFYPAVTLPTRLVPGPVFDQNRLEIVDVSGSSLVRTSTSVKLLPPAGRVIPPGSLLAQTYLVRPNADGTPQRILGQGNTYPDEAIPARFFGVLPDKQDRVLATGQNFSTGERLAAPVDYRLAGAALSLEANQFTLQPPTWQPEVRLTPRVIQFPNQVAGTVDGLQIDLRECGDKELVEVQVAYCPAGGTCSGMATMQRELDGSFEHTFFFDSKTPISQHGYIYLREPFRGAELALWYQLGGGVGPAHTGGLAPIVDGLLTVDLPQNVPNAPNIDNRVIYSPASICTSGNTLPPGISQIVDLPLQAQATVSDGNGGQPWGNTGPALRFRLSYDQDLLDRLGLDENRLVPLRWNGQVWEIEGVSGRSTELDWISFTPEGFSQIGEVVALGYGPAVVRLPFAAGAP